MKLHLFKQDKQKKEPNPTRQTDLQSIITSCKEGNRTAQKALYDALAGKMFPVCIRYMGDRTAAEDILQDGFITLFSNLEKYKGEGSFEGWARKIFVNTALMSLRKNDALKMSDDLDTAKELSKDIASEFESLSYRDLLKMIEALPSGYRTVFNMFVIEGYSHKEIAEALSINEATSRSQLQRARLMLQDKIKKEHIEYERD